MKKLNFLVLLFGILCFAACSEDNNGPALPPDLGGDVNVVVSRDTADSYKIILPVNSGEGLAKVTLTDVATSEVIDEKSLFSDPYAYTYMYNLDLKAYNRDTTISFVLKVQDLAEQVASKKITINVKKPSLIGVNFSSADEVTTYFNDCTLKLNVNRGGILPEKVNIFVNNELAVTYDLNVDPDKQSYEFYVLIPGLIEGSNAVKAVVVDKKNQEFPAEATVVREKGKQWSDVKRLACMRRNIDINFPSGEVGSDRLYRFRFADGMNGNISQIDFQYDDKNRVRSMALTKRNGSTLMEQVTYAYNYNTRNEVVSVTKQNQSGAPEDYVSNIVYECGNVKSYEIKTIGKIITPKYVEKEGEIIRVDCLDKNLSGLAYNLTAKTWSNPMYMPALPAIVPGNYAELEFNVLYNRYIFDSIEENGTVKYNLAITDIVQGFMGPEQSITWQNGGIVNSFVYSYK